MLGRIKCAPSFGNTGLHHQQKSALKELGGKGSNSGSMPRLLSGNPMEELWSWSGHL
jgi:hypothetical protein